MSGLRVAGQAVLPETRATGSPAQPEYLVDFWRVGQGLPHNTVNALLQSRNGYLWVGTAAGLARFDGLVFTVLGDETAQGLNQVCVTALLEDRSGALWVGTQRLGVLRLWRGKAEWFGVRKGLADEAVTSLAEDGTGTIWIGTQGGLNRWSDGRLSRFASSAIHAGDHIVALHAGGSGALWITTRFGVFRLQDGQATPFKSEHLPQGRNAEFIGVYEDYSGNLWAFGATFLLNVTQGRSLNNFPSFSLASSRVWTICEQHNGDFWIGTSGRGLFRFQNGRFEIVGAREGLEQCDVRALHADRTGNLWIGTSGNGLARLRPQILNVVGASHGLTAQRVTAIAADSPDGIWIGSADAGLWRWNGQRVEPFSGGFPLGGVTQIQTLCRGRDRSLWVGTWGAGLIQLAGGRQRALSTADGLADDIVLALTADPEADVIWAGTLSGDLHRITGTKIEQVAAVQELGVGPILCLLLRADKTLLIGTEQGGLLCWDGQQLSKVTLPGELFGKPIRCLYEDRKGGLWVGSLGGGALCQRGQTWIALGKPQGLASENIGVIAQDEAGHFWFGTTEHLYKARGGEVEGLLAGTRPSVTCLPVLAGLSTDGLKSVQGWPGVIRGAKGVQWIATSSDILPLGKVDKTSVEPPPAVLLEKVLVNGQPPSTPLAMGIGADANSGPEVLRLGPGMTSLDFEFTAIDFSAPEKIRFRHKLEGFDTEWVESDAARRAHYGPLPPGEYRFVVIAGKLDNAWNEVGASLNLVVTPPIWRAWWFLTISGILMVGLIWGVARFISARRFEARLRIAEQLHSMERERTRIAQDMHDEIGSKLTRISFLSEIARQTQASSVPVG
ncbi:MAG TPA: two-component regulator propeller domain-containing protein, partial [Clostridia bacterium]|nr:two-component regulator propeller domain-containing protein [Clostridia bacterium]